MSWIASSKPRRRPTPAPSSERSSSSARAHQKSAHDCDICPIVRKSRSNLVHLRASRATTFRSVRPASRRRRFRDPSRPYPSVRRLHATRCAERLRIQRDNSHDSLRSIRSRSRGFARGVHRIHRDPWELSTRILPRHVVALSVRTVRARALVGASTWELV